MKSLRSLQAVAVCPAFTALSLTSRLFCKPPERWKLLTVERRGSRIGELKGPDVAALAWQPAHAALVGRRAVCCRNVVDGRAAGKQDNGLRGAPVVLQATRIKLGVSVLQAACTRKSTGRAALQVVALIADPARAVVAAAVFGAAAD